MKIKKDFFQIIKGLKIVMLIFSPIRFFGSIFITFLFCGLLFRERFVEQGEITIKSVVVSILCLFIFITLLLNHYLFMFKFLLDNKGGLLETIMKILFVIEIIISIMIFLIFFWVILTNSY